MLLFERTYQISISRETGTFVVVCSLKDRYHNLILTQKVSLENPIILAGEIEVLKAPNPECQQLINLPQKLVGLRINKGFTRQVAERLGGSQGCVNLVNMALVSLPLVINATWLYHLSTGQYSLQEIEEMEQRLMAGVCLGYPAAKSVDSE